MNNVALLDVLAGVQNDLDKGRAILESYYNVNLMEMMELTETEAAYLRANHQDHALLFSAALDYLMSVSENIEKLSKQLEAEGSQA